MSANCYGCGDDNPIGLGLDFSRSGDGIASVFRPRPEHQGAPGFLHGGVAATALDETMAAVGWVLDQVHWVTATLELKYRRPVPLDGAPLRVEAWREAATGSPRRRRCFGRLVLADGTVAVEGTGIFVAAPESMSIRRSDG